MQEALTRLPLLHAQNKHSFFAIAIKHSILLNLLPLQSYFIHPNTTLTRSFRIRTPESVDLIRFYFQQISNIHPDKQTLLPPLFPILSNLPLSPLPDSTHPTNATLEVDLT